MNNAQENILLMAIWVRLKKTHVRSKAVEYWMSWVGVYFESGFEMSREEHSVSSPLPEFNRLGSRYCAS